MKLKKELGYRTYKEDGGVVEDAVGLKRAELVLLLLTRKVKNLREIYSAMGKTTRVVPVWRYVGAWHEDENLLIQEETDSSNEDRDNDLLNGDLA